MKTQRLTLLPEAFAICRLNPNDSIPPWATAGTFFSITRTPEELSIVCSQTLVPEGVQCERNWRCLRVVGPFALSAVGVLASLAQPLAEAGISILAIGTFDTDYLLIAESQLPEALATLRQCGHSIQ